MCKMTMRERILKNDSLPGDWWQREGSVKFRQFHVEEVRVGSLDDPCWKLVI